MFKKVHHVLQELYPITIGLQDRLEIDSIGAFVEFRGELIWKETYSRDVLIDAPEHFIQRQAFVAAKQVWSTFLDSIDWSTYWEL